MNDRPQQLIEHFFRHESANLMAVLTRVFGFSRWELVEDVVQSAIAEALRVWKIKGVPDQPAAWIQRVARNRLVDHLRRESSQRRHLDQLDVSNHSNEWTEKFDAWVEDSEIADSVLRLMFACCHPDLDHTSRIAVTLKFLCGFGYREIGRGLLMTEGAAKKRVQRARAAIVDQGIPIEVPASRELPSRLATVHEVLYLMFNEGYGASQGSDAIREDVCEEAARLCHILCQHPDCSTGPTRALLSLMLFHAARLPARIDAAGAIVLLEEQDRSQWDHKLISAGEHWLSQSAIGESISRFHLEAAIAHLHCRAKRFADTDWMAIIRLYGRLIDRFSSPIYVLNRAVALAQVGELQRALDELAAISRHPKMKDYYLLDCAFGQLYLMREEWELAGKHFRRARNRPLSDAELQLLDERISLCQRNATC